MFKKRTKLKTINMGKFVITTRKNGEFQFNLKAGNGQTILASEGYTTKTACLNGIESVRKMLQKIVDMIDWKLKMESLILI